MLCPPRWAGATTFLLYRAGRCALYKELRNEPLDLDAAVTALGARYY